MRAGRRCLSNEGVGGFLESILAVMAVITASSLFLVMMSVGAVQGLEEGMDMDELLDRLQEHGLWPQGDERMVADSMGGRFTAMVLPREVSGIHLTFRAMGERSSLMTFGTSPPEVAVVRAERAPALLDLDGRAVPGMVEVLVW